MRPTKEITELSKQLYKLGYWQEIQEGDWYLYGSRYTARAVFLATSRITETNIKDSIENDGHFIAIPSLPDVLLWLSKKYSPELWINQSDKWEIAIQEGLTIYSIEASTPHEVVLKAMVKVLEK